ncbi:MAG: antibiotic biosynthesis monooxygenase [Pseudomonadales bacterium]
MNPATHHVVVMFDTTRESQAQALAEIGAYVDSFLSQQPGFVESVLLASNNGAQIVHHAQWENADAFADAGVLARAHPDLPKLMAYTPNGTGYSLYQTY